MGSLVGLAGPQFLDFQALPCLEAASSCGQGRVTMLLGAELPGIPGLVLSLWWAEPGLGVPDCGALGP